MIQADDPTSLVTQHNVEESAAQMDALQELYSIKNLERRQRKLSKTKAQMQASRKITQVVENDSKVTANDDFVQMTLQSEQIVSWDLLALLHEFKNMYIIGIVGKPSDIQRFIYSLTGEKLQMPSQHSDCLHFSRRWIWPQNPIINWCFLIRYINMRAQHQSPINDVVFSIVPHLLVVFQSQTFDFSTVIQNCRKFHHLAAGITKVQQSLFLRTVKDRPDPSILTQRSESPLFMQSVVNCLISTSLSFVDTSHQQLLALLTRSIKRNYYTIINTEPITLYYLVVSLWTYMKRLLTISDSMLGNMTTSIKPLHLQLSVMDTTTLTNIYLQVLDKELRFNYKLRVEEYLKEAREEFFLYQCLKEEKESCLIKFRKYSAFCKIQKTKSYNKLCDFIKESEVEIHKWNEEANYRRNLQLATESAQNISYRISRNMYRSSNKDQFQKDFRSFMENYQEKCIGITAGQALSQFLKDFIPHIYRYFDTVTRQEIKEIVQNRHLAESRQGIQQRIVMTEGLLQTLERDIAEIQKRRQIIEKKRKKKQIQSNVTKDALRQVKQQILKTKRVITTTNKIENKTTTVVLQPPNIAPPKKKSKKICQIF